MHLAGCSVGRRGRRVVRSVGRRGRKVARLVERGERRAVRSVGRRGRKVARLVGQGDEKVARRSSSDRLHHPEAIGPPKEDASSVAGSRRALRLPTARRGAEASSAP